MKFSLIELFLCKAYWLSLKINFLKQNLIAWNCITSVFIFVFLFCIQFFLVIISIFKSCNIDFNIVLSWLLSFSLIISAIIQIYVRIITKKRWVLYNKEYMQNKWSIPLFIITLIFTFGGGFGLFFLIYFMS